MGRVLEASEHLHPNACSGSSPSTEDAEQIAAKKFLTMFRSCSHGISPLPVFLKSADSTTPDIDRVRLRSPMAFAVAVFPTSPTTSVSRFLALCGAEPTMDCVRSRLQNPVLERDDSCQHCAAIRWLSFFSLAEESREQSWPSVGVVAHWCQ